MNLWEGNIGPGFSTDNIHGTHDFETVYRNTLPGWQSQCEGGTCYAQTIPITLTAGSRYMNIIGNVLGQNATPAFTPFHSTYSCVATSTTACPASYAVNGTHDAVIFDIGYIGNTYTVSYAFCNSTPAGSCTTTGSGSTSPTLWRLGCPVRSLPAALGELRCGDQRSEIMRQLVRHRVVYHLLQYIRSPDFIGLLWNPVPTYGDTGAGQSAMPASFYYPLEPSFLGSAPWPVAGPDVTGGISETVLAVLIPVWRR